MHKELDLKGFICNRLRELRKQKEMTQLEVSEKLYMSQNAYSEMESGKRKIDINRLQQFSEIFNVPIQYFFE